MIQLIKKMFGNKPGTDLKELVRNSAQIIDVRTVEEYQSGHIQGSVNIPLQDFTGNLFKVRNDCPVIVCCASGMRSASAKRMLKSKGFTNVHNGGGWRDLQEKMA